MKSTLFTMTPSLFYYTVFDVWRTWLCPHFKISANPRKKKPKFQYIFEPLFFFFLLESWSRDRLKFYFILNLLETQIFLHFRATFFKSKIIFFFISTEHLESQNYDLFHNWIQQKDWSVHFHRSKQLFWMFMQLDVRRKLEITKCFNQNTLF